MSSVHTLGVPIRSVNWVRIFPALDAEGRDCLVAVMGNNVYFAKKHEVKRLVI